MCSLTFAQIQALIAPWTMSTRAFCPLDKSFSSITADSRQVSTGSVFVAQQGVTVDGWSFVPKALENGAELLVGEHTLTGEEATLLERYQCSYIQVRAIPEVLALLATSFWGNPSHSLQLIGVTGTNGKTTTVTLLHRLFSRLGYLCGLIGTVENRIGDTIIPSTHTTPDALALNALLRRMEVAGCRYVFMEVSSHAAAQYRIGSLSFAGAIFTNLTRDHLDYHGTMAEYIKAKKMFFDHLPASSFALINADDRNGAVMVQNTKANEYTYSLQRPADFAIKIVESDLCGMELLLDNHAVWVPLVGAFNAYNVGVVYAATRLLLPELSIEELLLALSTVRAAEGRFEVVSSGKVTAIVDYAHTPDALAKVLDTIRPLLPKGKRLITVVGAGGNRDKGKRPLMAQEAYKRSDILLLTSDNPRDEEPKTIIADMMAGLLPSEQAQVLVNVDRREAIRTACRLAQTGDVILVAGKGHETYQEIAGERYHFDDREELRIALSV